MADLALQAGRRPVQVGVGQAVPSPGGEGRADQGGQVGIGSMKLPGPTPADR